MLAAEVEALQPQMQQLEERCRQLEQARAVDTRSESLQAAVDRVQQLSLALETASAIQREHGVQLQQLQQTVSRAASELADLAVRTAVTDACSATDAQTQREQSEAVRVQLRVLQDVVATLPVSLEEQTRPLQEALTAALERQAQQGATAAAPASYDDSALKQQLEWLESELQTRIREDAARQADLATLHRETEDLSLRLSLCESRLQAKSA